MTARRRRWHYIIINSMFPVVFYNIIVFICYTPVVIIGFSIPAIVCSIVALFSLFEKEKIHSPNFKRKLRTSPIIVTNILILIFGFTTIWPIFSDKISMGQINAEYEHNVPAEDKRYENVIHAFQNNRDFNDFTIKDKLEIITYITSAESDYYGIVARPSVKTEIMDTSVLASASFDGNEITFNKAYLTTISKENLLQATLHEMAHIYQSNLIIMYTTQISDGDFEDLLLFEDTKKFINSTAEYITPREDIKAYHSQYSEESADEKAKERYAFYRKLIGNDYIGEYPS